MHATLSPTPYPSLSPPSSPHHTPIQCTLPWHYPRFPPPSPPPNSNAHPLTPSHPIPFPTHANPSSIPIPNSNVVALWEASGRSTLSMTITKQRHGCCSLCTLMNIIPVCTFSVTLFTRTSMQLQANKQTNKQTNKDILQWSYMYMYKHVNQFNSIPTSYNRHSHPFQFQILTVTRDAPQFRTLEMILCAFQVFFLSDMPVLSLTVRGTFSTCSVYTNDNKPVSL